MWIGVEDAREVLVPLLAEHGVGIEGDRSPPHHQTGLKLKVIREKGLKAALDIKKRKEEQ